MKRLLKYALRVQGPEVILLFDLDKYVPHGGKVRLLKNNRLKITYPKSEWAPGVVAGCEGFGFEWKNKPYLVEVINLEKRVLYCKEYVK